MRPVSCPICPKCSSKRFYRQEGPQITLKCRSCGQIIHL